MAGLLLGWISPVQADTLTWVGPVGSNGGDGAWATPENWVPSDSSGDYTNIGTTAPENYTTPATITIGSGVAAQSDNLRVLYGKTVTFGMEDTASFVNSGNLQVGGKTGSTASSSKLTIQGPESGEATVALGKIYMTQDTGMQNSLTLTGKLKVDLTGATANHYSDLNHGSTLTLDGGAVVSGTTNHAGQFYLRAKGANGLTNRMTIGKGTLEGTFIYLYDAALLQLSGNGILKASSASTSGNINIRVYAGGRFEAEGAGLTATSTPEIYETGTLAIGVTDSLTGKRNAAGQLTLNSALTFREGGILEIGIFGSGADEADRIAFGTGGSIVNANGATDLGTVIQLVLHNDYLPQAGDSWSLFTGTTQGNITGRFDLNLIDLSIWDLSKFNEIDGWTISAAAIPEPSTTALLLLAGGGVLLALRTRQS
ncbi:MAG TPA: PEP-CTERM sorting domain-containing protein [Chthoniobacteraceae bacterium]|nr:PEP-CTERM sorting domain-containing protein [Chthoniobacteraceae bacterium]